MITENCNEKTYLLAYEGEHLNRLIDAIKHDIYNYIKCERSRPIPPGVDFDCRVGVASVYLEICAKHEFRKARSAEKR